MHTNYCPHGTPHLMEEYVLEALNKGLKRVTFTEHAPLVMLDPTPEKDSAMNKKDVRPYLEEGERLKEKYKDKIEVNTGFEVDFIEGKEHETLAFLNRYKDTVAHSILSVHFLKLAEDDYFCIDYSKEAFIAKARAIGFDELYRLYEQALHLALTLPFGNLTPKTIGHITLINKFNGAYAFEDPIKWKEVLEAAKRNGYKLDYNFAGLDKLDYGRTYPPEELVEEARKMNIVLSTGSDAHHPKEVGRYFERSVVNG